VCLDAIRDCVPAHNNNFSSEERDLRAELALVLVRHDGDTLSPAVYAVIKSLESELSWFEHRGRL
jgi:hypothetical protein